jgi:hypothetical protein
MMGAIIVLAGTNWAPGRPKLLGLQVRACPEADEVLWAGRDMTSHLNSPPAQTENPVRAPVGCLSVVIETVTPEEYRAHGHDPHDPRATIEALAAQEGCGPIDVLLVTHGSAPEVTERLGRLPHVRIVSVAPDASYYEMKNAGGCSATTEYVGFLDADCTPGPLWARAALDALDDGADVVVGRTRYVGPGRWAEAMTFFDFGQIGRTSDGSATQFLLSNAVFRRSVFVTHQIDTRGRRSGGCLLASVRLRADNCPMAYAPAMSVTHENDYRDTLHLAKRLRNGHDAAQLFRLDEDELMPHRWIIPLGPFGAPLVAGKRIWDDWLHLARRHADLGFSALAVPCIALLSIPLRVVEGCAYALSSVRPSIIGKYWG